MNRKLAAGVASLMVLALLAGCSKPAENSKGTTDTSKNTPAKEKVLKYATGIADYKTLDPALNTEVAGFQAILTLMDGLTRQTAKGLEPALATSWDPSPDGLSYTFHLRDGIKWSNGDPITADDFAYAWTRALDPDTASEYAYQLYYIKGGEALNSVASKIKDASGAEVANPKYKEEVDAAKKALGIQVKDAKTLVVTLENPTPYFLELTAFPTLMPVNKKLVESNKDWSAKASTYVGSGPFIMESWEPKKDMVVKKNPNYWNKDAVKLDKVDFLFIEEQSTQLQLWESGQIDVMDAPPGQEMDRLKKENKVQTSPYYGTYYYAWNTTKKPFDDVRVRKALTMAIDRKAIVEGITKGGQKPAYAFVPFGSEDPSVKKDFREVGGNAFFTEDIAAAKKLLADAGYPDGKGFPEFEILYNTNEAHKAIAEAISEMWKKNLGITTAKPANVERKVHLTRMRELQFDTSRTSWIGDYADPMTFMDLLVKGGGNNDTGWGNEAYDKLIKTAKSTADQKVRMESMHAAEKILMDEMPVLPVYFYTNPYLQSDKVSNVFRNALGAEDFSFADMK